MKPVFLRIAAQRFFEGELDRLVDKGEERTASGMVAALSRLSKSIGAYPGSGSSSYASVLDLPGLRHRKLGRYAYLVFYVERENYIDVWQILLARMDILSRLRDPDSPAAADENSG